MNLQRSVPTFFLRVPRAEISEMLLAMQMHQNLQTMRSTFHRCLAVRSWMIPAIVPSHVHKNPEGSGLAVNVAT